ncbi:MAG TPA: DNRLRE domain-containing protein, partial [Candidatus Cloacimonetes bacterium]|nr:DNRLRE domain-containing protein [Candidatus Cloacimonadota bacterium]
NPYAWTSFTFSGTGGNYGIWFEVDITDLVQAWVNSQVENYGFVIRAQTGYKWSKFYSKEYSNPNLHPYLEINYTPSAVDENAIIFPAVNIENYPNPFNTETTISYQLQKSGKVSLSIYDIKGKLMETLVKRYQTNGSYSVTCHTSGFPSGVYFYQLVVDEYSMIKKCLLIKL